MNISVILRRGVQRFWAYCFADWAVTPHPPPPPHPPQYPQYAAYQTKS